MNSSNDQLSEKMEIASVIVRWAYALDQKDWEMAKSCFADHIEADYRDLRGGSLEVIPVEDFVNKRKDALNHLTTLHQSTNHTVELNGSDALCNSAFVIYRKDPSRKTENSFNSFGYYFHSLKKINGEWKITKVRQQLLWNEGNPLVHSGTSPILSPITEPLT